MRKSECKQLFAEEKFVRQCANLELRIGCEQRCPETAFSNQSEVERAREESWLGGKES